MASTDSVRIRQSIIVLLPLAGTCLWNVVAAQVARAKRAAWPHPESARRISAGPAPGTAQTAFLVQYAQHGFFAHANRCWTGRSGLGATRRSFARQPWRR